jgi:serine protease Do
VVFRQKNTDGNKDSDMEGFSTTVSRTSLWQSIKVYGLIGAVLLLTGAVAGAAMNAKGWAPFGGNARVPIYLAAGPHVAGTDALNTGFAHVARAVTPAVVTVHTSSRMRPRPFPFFGDPFWPFGTDPFREFFFRGLPEDNDRPTPRRQTPQPRRSPEGRGRLQPSGLGSGVIVSPEGYILTNNHVVDRAEKVDVSLNDGRKFDAEVVGTDPPSDVAVLKIEDNNFPTIPLGDSNQVEVGDLVLAIGNPLGVGQTVTMGIISAKGRSTRGSFGSGSYEDFLQTDASINRGNSGGALVNLKGELIGIPSQILSQTGGNIGIGFAIPTAMARSVMDQLLKTGKVQRGKLGVTISDLTEDLATQFGFKGTKGALVQDVESGQPANRAGVKAGDIVTEFQGQRIDDSSRLRNLVAQSAPGSTVKVKVWRDGDERELQVVLGEMDSTIAGGGPSRGGAGPADSALAGVRVENLTPEILRSLNLRSGTHGVVITDVDPESGAAAAGLERGDVIEEVNRRPVASVAEFNAALQRAGKTSVLLRVRRGENAVFVVVRPRE